MSRLLLLARCSVLVPGLLLLFACPPTEPVPSDDDDDELPIGEDRDLLILDRVLQNFSDPHTRNVEFEAELPAPAQWKTINMEYTLGCPTGGCDPWDRWANVEVQVGEGDEAEWLEIARVITPYGVAGTWRTDLTDLAPLLSGTRRFRSNVDTWVGGAQGWEVSITLKYKGGRPSQLPVAVMPVANAWVVYGVPDSPLQDQLPPRSVPVPGPGLGLKVRALITGHGQGNEGNCAEFCTKTHSLLVDDAEHQWTVWRDDCDQNRYSNQQGNWRPNRAGWCPGDDVVPEIWDLGEVSGESVQIGWTAEDYVNRCGGTESCSNCPPGFGGCEYNGGSHTEPRWSVGLVAVFYE